jgi:hypothetical protein
MEVLLLCSLKEIIAGPILHTHQTMCGRRTRVKYWAQLNQEALLRSRTKSDEDGSSVYFVFTLSHMVPAFSLLRFGYVCSTVVCIAECLNKRFGKG